HGDDVAALRLRRGVVRLAELHDVDAMLTERGPDRRRRVGCTGVDLKLDQAGHLLLRCHSCFPFIEPDARASASPARSASPNSGSPGVEPREVLEFRDLVEAELDGGLALEERDEDRELAALGLDLAD